MLYTKQLFHIKAFINYKTILIFEVEIVTKFLLLSYPSWSKLYPSASNQFYKSSFAYYRILQIKARYIYESYKGMHNAKMCKSRQKNQKPRKLGKGYLKQQLASFCQDWKGPSSFFLTEVHHSTALVSK